MCLKAAESIYYLSGVSVCAVSAKTKICSLNRNCRRGREKMARRLEKACQNKYERGKTKKEES